MCDLTARSDGYPLFTQTSNGQTFFLEDNLESCTHMSMHVLDKAYNAAQFSPD